MCDKCDGSGVYWVMIHGYGVLPDVIGVRCWSCTLKNILKKARLLK
jgi:hypothetical protein